MCPEGAWQLLRGRDPELSLADSQAREQKLRAGQGDGALVKKQTKQTKNPGLDLGA